MIDNKSGIRNQELGISRRRTILIYVTLILTLFLTLPSSLTAQTKKKVGLILSGGGAKGMAHIGVIRAMEKAGIRPDYVTGTSMGSIIGGLYSIGYSPDQMEAIMREINWDHILSNIIPLNYISYEEKEYYNRFLLELSVDKGKVVLPTGLIEGQMLSEALNHYTWPSMKYQHFDEFPIPFRCIGTDVSTGKEIVFERGSLAEAMRASMAIPTAFSAADLDSTLVVDGGVVNNFPVEVAMEMGADIIIGVNVSYGFLPASEVSSMTGILMQMAMLTANEKFPHQLEKCDIYIAPDMSTFNTASFGKYNEILGEGDRTGMLFERKFDSLAIVIGKKTIPPGVTGSADAVIIDSVRYIGNRLFNNTLISSKLGVKEGDSVAPIKVEEGVRNVYGINGFRKVEYRLEPKGDNHMNFVLKMKEKPPVSLRAAFHYDNTFSAGIVVNAQARDFLLKSSRAIGAVDISENPRVRFDYYKYTGRNQKVAVNLRYDYVRNQLPVYDKGNKIDVRVGTENSVFLNVLTTQSLDRSYLFGFRLEVDRYRSEYSAIFPTGVNLGKIEYGDFHFSYFKNTHDNRNYPTRGSERLFILEGLLNSTYSVKFKLEGDSIYLTDPDTNKLSTYHTEDEFNQRLRELSPSFYGRLYYRISDYLDVSRTFQFIPSFILGLNLSADTSKKLFQERNVGGQQQVRVADTRFAGLHYGEKSVLNFAALGLFMQNVIMKNFFLSYGANAMVYYDHIPIGHLDQFDSDKMLPDQLIIGYGGKITYKSFIGPVSFGMSTNTDDGYMRYYVALGYSFNYSD